MPMSKDRPRVPRQHTTFNMSELSDAMQLKMWKYSEMWKSGFHIYRDNVRTGKIYAECGKWVFKPVSETAEPQEFSNINEMINQLTNEVN